MSSAFALAAVTTVIRDLLNDGMFDRDMPAAFGNVKVTALPPDRISITSGEEPSQLNLFLYQVMPNQGWRNQALPSRDASGERLTNPPLALDLYYLLSAYGAQETNAEALLGYGMQLLHETPVLTRADINRTLKPNLPADVTLPPGLELLTVSDLAEQIEMIKICPHYLNLEELSKLWTAFQSKYRTSCGYHVSVVLIDSNKPTRSALPVLTQGKDDSGPQAQGNLIPRFPIITQLKPPNNQNSVLPGDTVELIGHDFARNGDKTDPTLVNVTIQLTSLRLTLPLNITVPVGDRTDTSIKFSVPSAAPAGPSTFTVQVMPLNAADKVLATEEAALLIAPKITSINGGGLPATVARDVNGKATLAVKCTPDVLPEQRVALAVGTREVLLSQVRTNVTDPLTFVLTKPDPGVYRVRLRVDGVESALVDHSNPARPVFDPMQKVTIT